MWREVMGFRNMPEQRCLLQGVLNPWHAAFPLWVLGLSCRVPQGEHVCGYPLAREAGELGGLSQTCS